MSGGLEFTHGRFDYLLDETGWPVDPWPGIFAAHPERNCRELTDCQICGKDTTSIRGICPPCWVVVAEEQRIDDDEARRDRTG